MKASDEVPHTSDLSEVVSGTTLYQPDVTNPGTVTTLAARDVTTSSVTLAWTATGDDGTTGTATTYDIRYATSLITDANWDSATQLTGEPAPSIAGSSETMAVGGLTDSTTYYFAIKVIDEEDNASALSNVASATTLLIPPTVEFASSSSSGPEGTTPASITLVLNKPSPQTVVVNYTVTGGTATQGSDFTLTPAGNVILAVKRNAELTAGGALSSQFAALTSTDVMLANVRDALIRPDGSGAYMNYGASPQSPISANHILVGFDVAALSGAVINKAELRLRTTSGNTAMRWAGIKSHDWAEGNKTGNFPGTVPAAPGVCWMHPAGLYTGGTGAFGWGANSDSTFSVTDDGDDIYALTTFVSQPQGAAWCVADVTSLVQEWANGTKANYGIYVAAGNHPCYFSEYGSDYQPVLFIDATITNYQVSFQPGETSKTIDLGIVDDATAEADETIQLTLTNPVNATLGTNRAHTFTIDDNDSSAGQPSVLIDTAPAFAYEGQSLTLHASGSDPSGYPLAYTWTQTAGQAAELTLTDVADLSFAAPVLTSHTGQALTFEVTVDNSHGGTASDTATVPVYITGDANHDGHVNVGDLQTLLTAWATQGTPSDSHWNPAADLNTDGYINIGDLQSLAANWSRDLP